MLGDLRTLGTQPGPSGGGKWARGGHPGNCLKPAPGVTGYGGLGSGWGAVPPFLTAPCLPLVPEAQARPRTHGHSGHTPSPVPSCAPPISPVRDVVVAAGRILTKEPSQARPGRQVPVTRPSSAWGGQGPEIRNSDTGARRGRHRAQGKAWQGGPHSLLAHRPNRSGSCDFLGWELRRELRWEGSLELGFRGPERGSAGRQVPLLRVLRDECCALLM